MLFDCKFVEKLDKIASVFPPTNSKITFVASAPSVRQCCLFLFFRVIFLPVKRTILTSTYIPLIVHILCIVLVIMFLVFQAFSLSNKRLLFLNVLKSKNIVAIFKMCISCNDALLNTMHDTNIYIDSDNNQ